MKELGYPATWRTVCFIDSACGKHVFAHTNGSGDFVLFDDLSPPWPVHRCYELRATYAEYLQLTGKAPFGAPQPQDFVYDVKAEDAGKQKRFDVVGTVTEVRKAHARTLRESTFANPDVKAEIRRVLEGRNDLVRIVTGGAEAFEVFVDLREHPIAFNDIVAAVLRVRKLFNGAVFVMTSSRVFSAGSSR